MPAVTLRHLAAEAVPPSGLFTGLLQRVCKAMPPQEGRRQRSDAPFVEELPRLLKERGISISAIARSAGTQQSHLSRVLRGMDYKRPSADLARRVARALGLPDDYFPEYREGKVVDRLRTDPAFRDALYERLAAKESGDRSS